MLMIHYFRYPWDVCGGAATAMPMDALHWSSAGILKVPVGCRLRFPDKTMQSARVGNLYFTLSMPFNEGAFKLNIREETYSKEVEYKMTGPVVFGQRDLISGKTVRDSVLYKTILSWSSFFDECLVGNQAAGNFRLTWDSVSRRIEESQRNPNEPQMSLVVRISKDLGKTIGEFAKGLRRVLTRERRMMQADRTEEFDTACIDWYVRQPGFTALEKAAYNQQKLKAVARKDYVDTLENRVLKDFLKRCKTEVEVYLLSCTKKQRQSIRAKMVRFFGRQCQSLLELPVFEVISPVYGLVEPNYALQGDSRYRKIWKYYCQLLRKQKAYDYLWIWQSQVWSDAVALSIGVAMNRLPHECIRSKCDWTISEIGRAEPLIGMEQLEGHRFDTSSIPGPFIIKPKNQDLNHASVLEIVQRNQIDDYLRLSSVIPALMLRDSFADLTLIFTPLDSKRKPSVLFCWSCHCIADGEANKQEMQNHMERAIDRLNISKKVRAFGVAFISARELDLDVKPQKSFVLPLSIDVSDWSMNIDKINWALRELIGEIL